LSAQAGCATLLGAKIVSTTLPEWDGLQAKPNFGTSTSGGTRWGERNEADAR